MTRAVIEKIINTANSICPLESFAFLDKEGHLLKGSPGNAEQSLPAAPGFYPFSEHRFLAALPVGEEGIFSFCAMVEHSEDAPIYYNFINQSISLIRQQESISHQIAIQSDEISILLNRLFNYSRDEDTSYIMLSAVHHGYHMMLKRIIILLDFQLPAHSVISQAEITSSIQTFIKNMPEINNQDLIGQLNEHQIVICKTFPESEKCDIQGQYLPYLSNLRSLLDRRSPVQVWIGVGDVVQEIHEYSKGLSVAHQALKFAKQFKGNQKICFIDDYLLESEIARLPRPVLDHFFGAYAAIMAKSNWMFETIAALIHNDMDQKSAAQALYIHRNTLVFRLKQIQEKLHLNPYQNDSDRYTLTALYIYLVLYPSAQEVSVHS